MEKFELKSMDCFVVFVEVERDKLLSLFNFLILRDFFMVKNFFISEEGKCSMNCFFILFECV